jgi:hypothetical protein
MNFDITTLLSKLKNVVLKTEIDQAKKVSRSKHILDTHWYRIPNVKHFGIEVKEYNMIFEFFGIAKKNNPIIEISPYKNAKFNIYMERQIRRLRKLKSNPKKFFAVSWFLMKNSKVFRVSAINKTMKRWYKEIPFGVVMKADRGVNRILKNEDSNLSYRRVYIPKGENDHRPLGVPDVEWRIVLQMTNNFLYIFLEDIFLKSQHGFLPNKGTLTAWVEVLKISKAKYIYEYDLKQFFPSVNNNKIFDHLISLGTPLTFSSWLEAINARQPILPTKELLDESGVKKATFKLDMISDPSLNFTKLTGVLLKVGKHIVFVKRQLPPLPRVRNNKVTEEWLLYEKARSLNWKGPDLKDVIKVSRKLADSWTVKPQFNGVPQGSNTGPLLSLIALIDFLKQQPSVSYADDGVFYGDEPFEILDRPEWGVNLHPEKSGWVKKDGNWLKPLKFLGLTWDGSSLRAETRKGSKLVADNMKAAFSLLTSNSLRSLSGKYALTWDSILEAQFGGTLISKLYNGTWNMDEARRQCRINRPKGCILPEDCSFYNASSFASHALIRILTNKRKRYIQHQKGIGRIQSNL